MNEWQQEFSFLFNIWHSLNIYRKSNYILRNLYTERIDQSQPVMAFQC